MVENRRNFRYNEVMYDLELVTNKNADLWDRMLHSCPYSTAFQAMAWRNALTASFKQMSPLYYLIRQGKEIVGGLPMFIFQPMPGIRMLHSMPWNLLGGLQLIEGKQIDLGSLVETIETTLNRVVLEQGIFETVYIFDSDHIDLYERKLVEFKYKKLATQFTHLLKINPDYEILWAAYNKRVRGAVRKAVKNSITVTDVQTDGELKKFYQIYLATQERLDGTPKPFMLVYELVKIGLGKISIAKKDDQIIAGLLYLVFNRTITLWCAGSLPEFWHFRPNNAIFDHIIRQACHDGYDYVDFGASPPENQGLIKFKEEFRARRSDFVSYAKVHSPVKKKIWEKTEPMLRRIYAWAQHT